MQEPMITEVVISVGDQDREGYPPPELAQVSCRGRGPFLDPSRDLQVAALVTVAGLEHCHRAGVADAGRTLAVEPVHDEDVTVADTDQLGIRNLDRSEEERRIGKEGRSRQSP